MGTDSVQTTKLEFLKRKEVDLNCVDVTPEAETEIKKANADDILGLTITINSPVKIVEAKIMGNESFAEMFFDGIKK